MLESRLKEEANKEETKDKTGSPLRVKAGEMEDDEDVLTGDLQTKSTQGEESKKQETL